MWVWSLDWKDPLEEEMATHSSIPAWKIPWTEESGRLKSKVSQRVRHNWVTKHVMSTYYTPGPRTHLKHLTVHSEGCWDTGKLREGKLN